MKVLAISGSLRRDSLNTRLLRAAAELAPSGVEVELLDPSVIKELPIYDQDDDGTTPPVAARRLRGSIRLADAILVSTPEYNGSIPGGLKNAVDWASRPFPDNAWRDKPVAVIGASTGAFGAVWSQAELRKVLSAIGARVVDAEVAVGHAPTRFDEDGRLVDENLLGDLEETIGTLVAEVHERSLLGLTNIRS
jgi:chromate reductase, NAD(P)H dehydrogenase (quinone)